jgi:hypothetical protein
MPSTRFRPPVHDPAPPSLHGVREGLFPRFDTTMRRCDWNRGRFIDRQSSDSSSGRSFPTGYPPVRAAPSRAAVADGHPDGPGPRRPRADRPDPPIRRHRVDRPAAGGQP